MAVECVLAMEEHLLATRPPDLFATLFVEPDFLRRVLRDRGTARPSKLQLEALLVELVERFRNQASWLHPREHCPSKRSGQRKFEYMFAPEYGPYPRGGMKRWLHAHLLIWNIRQVPIDALCGLWRSIAGISDPKEPHIDRFCPGGRAVRYCLKTLYTDQDKISFSSKLTHDYLVALRDPIAACPVAA